MVAFSTETSQIINVLLLEVLIKPKARSTALASAVKIEVPSGIHCILQWLSDRTSQPTFESFLDPSVYTEQKKNDNKNVTYIVPKIVTPKRYRRTIVCIFIAWQTSCSHLHKEIFLFHHSWQKYQTVTENVPNSGKHAIRMSKDINFHLFKIYEYSSIKKWCVQYVIQLTV